MNYRDRSEILQKSKLSRPTKTLIFAYKRFDISVIVLLQIIEGVLKTFIFNHILNTLLNHYGVCEASVTMTRMNAVPTISDDFLRDSQNNSNNKKILLLSS